LIKIYSESGFVKLGFQIDNVLIFLERQKVTVLGRDNLMVNRKVFGSFVDNKILGVY
jgi:hypothetical protein